MESDEADKTAVVGTSTGDNDSRCAINSLILDYYKKFGRKRDLEQFFSLSTAQTEIRDTSGTFWRKMKNENDSSDSGGRKSDSSAHELCRISIRCTVPDSSQSDDPKTKTESPPTESPPIITEEAPIDISRETDNDSIKSDDNQSHKSFDPLLDLSSHKPGSPTSSITSQRKLEWDSLADVGYANESDRKNSASSLSTLERLALKQQYSNNDSKQDIGLPTSHSTPVDEKEKSKLKKSAGRKMTKFVKKDVDFVEVNVPHTSDTNHPQSINVNLTKHISFNVEKDGGITVDSVSKDVSVSPEKVTVGTEVTPNVATDREIQTTLPKTIDKSHSSINKPDVNANRIPVIINLNTLKKRLRRKRGKVIRRRLRTKKKSNENQGISPLEKSGEQLSEAESFEYMPGHIYNQNQIKANEANKQTPENNNAVGNKSSLESSGGLTTDSSKASKHSLTKDLEKCIDVLKVTLQRRFDDSEMKKKLIKEIVQRLLNSKYRDDESTTDFLSGLSFSSKKLDLKGNNTTSSTSDADKTDDSKAKAPKKSILRMDKFDSNAVASTSQSAPNLYTATNTEKSSTNLIKMLTSNTESDESSKGKISSDNDIPKTSSEELYMKYLQALKREQSYKKHLRDKEVFLKQKLGSSETAFNASIRQDAKINDRLKDLMNDLTRNNYDDGSGDASKLEGGSSSERNCGRYNQVERIPRSHSVFTLSSSHSDSHKKPNLKKKMQIDRDLDASTSRNHYCCCPHHSKTPKVGYADSSVQVNIHCQYDDANNDQSSKCPNCHKRKNVQGIESHYTGELKLDYDECNSRDKPYMNNQIPSTSCQKCTKSIAIVDSENESNVKYNKCPKNIPKMISDKSTGDIKYVCVCKEKPTSSTNTGDFMIYKCSKLTNRGIQFEDPDLKPAEQNSIRLLKAPCQMASGSNSSSKEKSSTSSCCKDIAASSSSNTSSGRKRSKSSQTNLLIKMMMSSDYEPSDSCGASTKGVAGSEVGKNAIIIHEATRSLQTEISINPKISDPTISDINIVANCAELISEQRREIVKSNTETFSDVFSNSGTGRLLRSGESLCGIKDSDINIIEAKDSNMAQCQKPNDYSIPIEGTNMTLMVSLASLNATEKKDQSVGTEKAMIVEQSTCIASECAKSVQCLNNMSSNSTKNNSSIDRSSNKSSTSCSSPRRASSRRDSLRQVSSRHASPRQSSPRQVFLGQASPRKTSARQVSPRQVFARQISPKEASAKQVSPRQASPRQVSPKQPSLRQASPRQVSPKQTFGRQTSPKKSCLSKPTSEGSPVRNTYPKAVHLRERKTLRRSNTDTGKLETCCGYTQTESLSKMDPIPIKIRPVSKTSENCCRGRETDSGKNKRSSSSEEESSGCKEDKGIQKDMSENESREKECKPEMISKCVGSKLESPRNACGVSCQTDVEEKPKKAACGKCNEGECVCNDINDCNIKKNKCSICNYEGGCNCNKNQECALKKKKSCGKCGYDEPCPCENDADSNGLKDPILDLIKDITRRYSKNNIQKIKKKKCFTEIVTVLNYLLETEDSTDQEGKSSSVSPETSDNLCKPPVEPSCCDKNTKKYNRQPSKSPKRFVSCRQSSPSPNRCDNNKRNMKSKSTVCCESSKKSLRPSESESLPNKHDKGIQLSSKSTSKCTDSSDMPCSTSDSAACRILNKIKRECEKYHLRRNKCGRKCEISSSTSVNCNECKKIHSCSCRHRCKRSKTFDKLQKKCVAYNLILQTSESMLSEETICEKGRPLQNVVVKVPKRKEKLRTCKETLYEIEKGIRNSSPRLGRSKSCPKETEMSSTDDFVRRAEHCTVREYLEKNRPDFVQKSSERQSCLKYINEMRASERASHRDLLSLHLDREPDLTTLNSEQLRQLAQQIGIDLRRKKNCPKFMSERAMKKHSEKIYKTLPEVIKKKEEKKKENIKKTNLLMANIFKKNLQKKTLRGYVNLSNYNSVMKI